MMHVREWRKVVCQDGTVQWCQDDGLVAQWLATIETGQTQSNAALHGPIIRVAKVVEATSEIVVYGMADSPALPTPPRAMPPVGSDAQTRRRMYVGAPPE